MNLITTRNDYKGTAKCILDMYHHVDSGLKRGTVEHDRAIKKVDMFVKELTDQKYSKQELESMGIDPELGKRMV